MRKYIISAFWALALICVPVLAEQPIRSYSSGNVANAAAVATITGKAQQTTYITGFELSSGGATAGACVSPTITGLLGGTATFTYCAPTGAAVAGQPLVVQFSPPLRSSAVNTNIVVTLPALGAGNTNATAVAHGYVE